MASFSQLISQLESEQNLESSVDRASLGIDVEQESQDLEAARSDYYDKVEQAEREIARKQRSRSKRGLFGTLLGTALSFTPLGPLGGALIGGAASGLGRRSVKPYAESIKSSLPGGKFHNQARIDHGKNLASTNQFFEDSRKGQGFADWANAVGDAVNIFGTSNMLGDMGIGSGKLRRGAENKIMDLRGKKSGFGKNLFKGRVGENVQNRVLQHVGSPNIDWRGGNPLELLFDIQEGTLADGFMIRDGLTEDERMKKVLELSKNLKRNL